MEASTAILCNLEFYRGADVDGGSLYEVGMAYAKGARCYGYTRDKRPMVWKYQGGELRDGIVYDRKGRPLPYADLPFSPNVMGAMKIVEGDFDDCLQVFALDTEELRKRGELPAPPVPAAPRRGGLPVLYLAGPERYDPDCLEQYDRMKALCREAGVAAGKVFPHNLRHLFARTFYKVEKDLARLADILGHSNINTTRIYTLETGTAHRRRLDRLQLLL